MASPFPRADTYQPPPYVQALPPSYPGRDLPHRTAQEPERDEFLTLNNFQVSRKEGGYAQEDAGVNVRGSKGQPAQGLLVDAGQGQGGLLDAFKFRKGPTVNYQAEGRRLEDLTNPGNQMQYSGVFGQQKRSGNFMEDYSDYHEISLE